MKTVHFTETVEAKTKLDVWVEIGSVEIRPSADDNLHIEATYRHMDIWVERHEGTIFVRAEQDADFIQKLARLFRNNHPKAKLIIDVPAHCPIQAKTVTGSMAIEGVAAPVSARVVAGQLRMQDIDGSIYAKAVTGQLTYTGNLTDENHRFESATGEIVLTIPETVNAQLSAKTGVGNVSCTLPLTDQRAERHLVGGNLWGILGSGAGRIKAKIGTGTLEIRPLHPKQKEPEEQIPEPELV
ncbi:hypothetical protein [Candidatus Leptofilum sp.]|uniref:hypothetical protein n=1 Tax=Candidatus Leptofilum sp. TaxID=3241576 RepID=UPI003B5BBA22